MIVGACLGACFVGHTGYYLFLFILRALSFLRRVLWFAGLSRLSSVSIISQRFCMVSPTLRCDTLLRAVPIRFRFLRCFVCSANTLGRLSHTTQAQPALFLSMSNRTPALELYHSHSRLAPNLGLYLLVCCHISTFTAAAGAVDYCQRLVPIEIRGRRYPYLNLQSRPDWYT